MACGVVVCKLSFWIGKIAIWEIAHKSAIQVKNKIKIVNYRKKWSRRLTLQTFLNYKTYDIYIICWTTDVKCFYGVT